MITSPTSNVTYAITRPSLTLGGTVCAALAFAQIARDYRARGISARVSLVATRMRRSTGTDCRGGTVT